MRSLTFAVSITNSAKDLLFLRYVHNKLKKLLINEING